MPLPTTRQELLSRLRVAYKKLVDEAIRVPVARERLPELEGGISPCDLIAYQIGWGCCLLTWDELESRGENVEMPAPGFKWNQLGLLAQSFYKTHEDQTLTQLLHKFETLIEEVVHFIESNSDDTLFGTGKRTWTGQKWSIAKWIQVNTIAPYGSARTRLRKCYKSNDKNR